MTNSSTHLTTGTITGFFHELRCINPGLEPVCAAVGAGNTPAAVTAYAAYLRNKPWDKRLLTVCAPVQQSTEKQRTADARSACQEADAIADGTIKLIGRTVAFGAQIDWRHAPDDLPDFALMLNRHYHWVELAQAYQLTGDSRYLRAFEQQFRSWLAAMPAPDADLRARGHQIERFHGHRRPFAPGWRTIEVGERLRDTWPKILGVCLRQPALSDATLVAMVASMVEQADFLLEFEGPQNWMYIESAGLLQTAGLFPELRQSESWRRAALQRVEAAIRHEVYPSGAHEELTFWYQNVVRDSVAGVVDLAEAQGLTVPPAIHSQLESLYESMLKAVQPDGLLPQVNDGDRLPAAPILKEGAARYQRADFSFIASAGYTGRPPDFTSINLPEPGWAIMRSSWQRDAGYLFFDGGPFGGHAHEDKLSFILHAQGCHFITDTGRATYADNAWRRFNIGPMAHSTVLFDGIGQCRRWWPNQRLMRSPATGAEGFSFSSSEQFDIASANFGENPDEIFYEAGRGFRFVVHRRTIVFIKPSRWLIVDTFHPRSAHPELTQEPEWRGLIQPKSATALFQCTDLPYQLSNDDPSFILGPHSGPRMRLSWASQTPLTACVHRGQQEPQLLGWQFADMNLGHHALPIPTLALHTPLAGLPHLQAYWLSVTPGDMDLPGESIHINQNGDQVTLEILTESNVNYRFSSSGAPLLLPNDKKAALL